MSIAENIQTILSRIDTVAKECGRDPKDIQLVAVSKLFPASAIDEAIKAGQLVFGENYIQEAEKKNRRTWQQMSFPFYRSPAKQQSQNCRPSFRCDRDG